LEALTLERNELTDVYPEYLKTFRNKNNSVETLFSVNLIARVTAAFMAYYFTFQFLFGVTIENKSKIKALIYFLSA